MRRLAVIVAVSFLVLGVLAAPAFAGEGGASAEGGDALVVLNGDALVDAQTRVDGVLVFNGDAIVRGEVEGSVIVFNGDARIAGRVQDDVVAFSGRASIERGGLVEGDVASSSRPEVASGGEVRGDARKVNFAAAANALGWVLWIGWWLAVTLAALAAGLLLLGLTPRAAAAALEVAQTRIGPSIGWGLLLAVVVPLVAFFVIFTLVGAALGLLVLMGTVVAMALGYAVGALCLGRLMVKGSAFGAFLLGLLILRLVDLVPVLGPFVSWATAVYGVGALAVAAWRAGRSSRAEAAEPGSKPEQIAAT